MLRGLISCASVLAIIAMMTQSARAHDKPAPGGTESHVDLKQVPTTVRRAESKGYVVPPPSACVPGMGRHAVKTKRGVRQMPLLLFNNNDRLVGIEFTTRVYPDDPGVLLNEFGIDLNDPTTWPVQVPPWEGPVGPHPGWPANTIHWDLHIYMVGAEDAETICQ